MSRRVVLATLVASLLCAARLGAQGPDSVLTGFRLSFPGDSLVLRENPAFAPGLRFGLRIPPDLAARLWAEATLRKLSSARTDRWRTLVQASLAPPAAPAEPVVAGPPEAILLPPAPPLITPERPTFGALGSYADLGLQTIANFQLKLDHLKNLRCTVADAQNPFLGCRGGFPTPALDQQFSVIAGGVVGNRFHVNVNWDSENEFSANNNINVYYEGREDEILRRVDLGNVSFIAPPSRFITAAIPANSFGIQAEAQLGPLDFRTIIAQQKGSELRERFYTVGETTTEPIDREARDLDFESGRFFFVVNPLSLPGYPALDILNINREALPAPIRPAQVRVYRLRAQSGTVGSNPNLGGVTAVAVRNDSPQRVGPFPWDLLVEGRDYYLDPSGVWVTLLSRVTDEDYLAVSYVTAAGDTIGTFPSINGTGDTLELIYEPRRGPEVPTFNYEMRNAYRVGSNTINRTGIELALRVNESERPLDGQGTYLARLGLALPQDQSTVDQFNRVFPRARDPGGGLPIRDLFVVFPHLVPFADTARLQPGERNDSLYRTPRYLLSSQGPPPRFRLQFHYSESGAGDRGHLSLRAFQIRVGSEKLFVGDRQLVQGRDYQIDYALGEVTFTNPDSLFAGPSQVRAEFEENQNFDIAPKSILGLSSTYSFGSTGRISALGLLQRERSSFTRPQLGFEPQSIFLGGVSGSFLFRSDGITGALNRLPLLETNVPSSLSLDGELAFSRPNPNQQGQAYVEEFEGESSRVIGLGERSFQLGSRPSSGRGLPITHLGSTGGFDVLDAVPLVWQNLIPGAGGRALEFEPTQIDSTIVLFGAVATKEVVLWMTLKPDTVGGAAHPDSGTPRWLRPHTPGPRWRSITQPLDARSGLGIDVSRTEFFEFWVLEDAERKARSQNAYLVFDFGTVFEDAVAPAPDTFRVAGADTAFSGLQFVGTGRLDSEKDTLTNVFNAVRNDVGIHGDLIPSIFNLTTNETVTNLPMCDFSAFGAVPVFPLGDVGARCTRRNAGLADTEDMNGDNRLDITVGTAQEDLVRFVFPVGDDEHFVREGTGLQDGAGRSLVWRLYRIPFREDTIQIGSPNVRQVRAMRMTLVAPDRGPAEEEFFLALARMRLVGAPWLKRAATPIAGLSGSRGEPRGEVVASIVTTENADLGYTPPPGIINQSDRRGLGFAELTTEQINERSLRLLASGLRTNDRAEAFRRFQDEADKNFLKYRQLRVWARGRGPGWDDGDLEFFVKVGRDDNNYYLYRVPVRTFSWEPEVVVDMDRWLTLRTQIESSWLRGEPPSGAAACGGDSTAYVACDGHYMVQVRDAGISPPNLARVSEIAVGIFRSRETVFIDEAELWVDDIRLSDVVSDVGTATAVDVRFNAADVAEFTASFSSKDDRFRQLSEDATFTSDAAMRLGTTVRLDKFTPASWGLTMPLSLQYARTTSDPFFLNRSDVRAEGLPDLRRPENTVNSAQLLVRRVRRGESFLEHLLVDPITLTALRQTANGVTELSSARSTNTQVRVDYANLAGERSFRFAPGFLIGLVNAMPGFIKESDFGKGIRTSRLRWNPFQVRLATMLTNNRTTRFTYRAPVQLPADAGLAPLQSVIHTWQNDAGLDLRPFSSFSIRGDYSSTRDMQDYGDTTTLGRLLARQRRDLAGLNVGFERLRLLNTSVNLSPAIGQWFLPRLTIASSFTFNRDPSSLPVRLGDDSTGAFRTPESVSNARTRDLGSTFNLGRLAHNVVGDSSLITKALKRLEPINVSHTTVLRSAFDRIGFSPGLRYQLGFGGVDDFRAHEGVIATSAGRTEGWNVSSGAELPLGLRGRITYVNQENTIWSRRGDTQSEIFQLSREWPSGTLTWVYSPRAQWILNILTSISAQANLRKTISSTFVPPVADASGVTVGEGVRTEIIASTVSPGLNVTWSGGTVTSANYSRSISDAVTSGNITRSDQKTWAASMTFGFRPPRSLVRLPSDLLTSLSVLSTANSACLIRAGTVECTAVSDSRSRSADVRISTLFSAVFQGGMSFNYVLREQLHTSTKVQQIIFTVFAEVRFQAGRLQ